MARNPLLATVLPFPDDLKRDFISRGLANLASLERGFRTNDGYDAAFLRDMEQGYKIFFVTDRSSGTRYGVFIKPGSTVFNTYCRAVVTISSGEEALLGEWGRAMLRRDDQGNIAVLPGW